MKLLEGDSRILIVFLVGIMFSSGQNASDTTPPILTGETYSNGHTDTNVVEGTNVTKSKIRHPDNTTALTSLTANVTDGPTTTWTNMGTSENKLSMGNVTEVTLSEKVLAGNGTTENQQITVSTTIERKTEKDEKTQVITQKSTTEDLETVTTHTESVKEKLTSTIQQLSTFIKTFISETVATTEAATTAQTSSKNATLHTNASASPEISNHTVTNEVGTTTKNTTMSMTTVSHSSATENVSKNRLVQKSTNKVEHDVQARNPASMTDDQIMNSVTIVSTGVYSSVEWFRFHDYNFRLLVIETLHNNYERMKENSTLSYERDDITERDKRSTGSNFETRFTPKHVYYVAPTPMYRYNKLIISFFVCNSTTEGEISSSVPKRLLIKTVIKFKKDFEAVIGGNLTAILPGLYVFMFEDRSHPVDEDAQSDHVVTNVGYIYALLIGVFLCVALAIATIIYVQCRNKRKYCVQAYHPPSYRAPDSALQLVNDLGYDLNTDADCTKDETKTPNSKMYKMSEYQNWAKPLNDHTTNSGPQIKEKTKF
ncbi:Uncharacterised protein g9449 [Pycnogonum litorale]